MQGLFFTAVMEPPHLWNILMSRYDNGPSRPSFQGEECLVKLTCPALQGQVLKYWFLFGGLFNYLHAHAPVLCKPKANYIGLSQDVRCLL